jgi:CBS domain-containing protein
MNDEKVGAILVRDYRDRPLGLISERDLAIAIATRGAAMFRSSLFDLMAVSGPTAGLGDSVHEVTRRMLERRASYVPVLDGATVVGVVSIGDLLRARLAEKSQENAVLQDLARMRLSD